MTKAELVEKISKELGYHNPDVAKIVDQFMSSVKEAAIAGEPVYLRGFGSFIIKGRAEKTGRNIRTNTPMKIPAHNVPVFKPCADFVNAVRKKVPASRKG